MFSSANIGGLSYHIIFNRLGQVARLYFTVGTPGCKLSSDSTFHGVMTPTVGFLSTVKNMSISHILEFMFALFHRF